MQLTRFTDWLCKRVPFPRSAIFTRFPLFNLLPILILFSLSISSCKKGGDDDEPDDDLPILGTCKPQATVGGFSYNPTMDVYSFQSSGGANITINSKMSIKVTHNTYPGFSLEYWGTTTVNGQTIISANHENLNGKHIKDRVGSRRSLILPDGAKITWITDGEIGGLLSVSIYDGAQAHHVNFTCKKIEYSGINESIAKRLDAAQPDGETAAIEFTSTGLIYFNTYTEDTPGNKINKRVNLGEIFKNQPSKVDDYYDDPRLGST